jgi:putative phosphoribosyl transferase
VAPADSLAELEERGAADETVAALTPDNLSSIGEWYEDFTQLTDEEVLSVLCG